MSEPASAPSTRTNDVWTSRRLLEWMAKHLEAKGIDSPRLTGELLLAHVLNCERLRLYMEVDRPASPRELAALRDGVRRVAAHEPVQYVIGEGWFFARAFTVSRLTLIPRPSTESLVECVVADARERGGDAFRIADIGTGTGCLAITLAAELPNAMIVATDLDEETIDLARTNARRHNVLDRIEFRVGSLFAPLSRAAGAEQFDYVCSNPPYIPDHEWPDVPPNVRDHEPALALRGGADGLDVIRPLIAGAADHLRPGGRLVLEIAHCHHDLVIELVERADGLSNPRVLTDHEGLWRVLVAEGK